MQSYNTIEYNPNRLKRSLFKMKLQIDGNFQEIEVFEGDTPEQLATNFCQNNQWEKEYVVPVAKKIQSSIEQYYVQKSQKSFSSKSSYTMYKQQSDYSSSKYINSESIQSLSQFQNQSNILDITNIQNNMKQFQQTDQDNNFLDKPGGDFDSIDSSSQFSSLKKKIHNDQQYEYNLQNQKQSYLNIQQNSKEGQKNDIQIFLNYEQNSDFKKYKLGEENIFKNNLDQNNNQYSFVFNMKNCNNKNLENKKSIQEKENICSNNYLNKQQINDIADYNNKSSQNDGQSALNNLLGKQNESKQNVDEKIIQQSSQIPPKIPQILQKKQHQRSQSLPKQKTQLPDQKLKCTEKSNKQDSFQILSQSNNKEINKTLLIQNKENLHYQNFESFRAQPNQIQNIKNQHEKNENQFQQYIHNENISQQNNDIIKQQQSQEDIIQNNLKQLQKTFSNQQIKFLNDFQNNQYNQNNDQQENQYQDRNNLFFQSNLTTKKNLQETQSQKSGKKSNFLQMNFQTKESIQKNQNQFDKKTQNIQNQQQQVSINFGQNESEIHSADTNLQNNYHSKQNQFTSRFNLLEEENFDLQQQKLKQSGFSKTQNDMSQNKNDKNKLDFLNILDQSQILKNTSNLNLSQHNFNSSQKFQLLNNSAKNYLNNSHLYNTSKSNLLQTKNMQSCSSFLEQSQKQINFQNKLYEYVIERQSSEKKKYQENKQNKTQKQNCDTTRYFQNIQLNDIPNNNDDDDQIQINNGKNKDKNQKQQQFYNIQQQLQDQSIQFISEIENECQNFKQQQQKPLYQYDNKKQTIQIKLNQQSKQSNLKQKIPSLKQQFFLKNNIQENQINQIQNENMNYSIQHQPEFSQTNSSKKQQNLVEMQTKSVQFQQISQNPKPDNQNQFNKFQKNGILPPTNFKANKKNISHKQNSSISLNTNNKLDKDIQNSDQNYNQQENMYESHQSNSQKKNYKNIKNQFSKKPALTQSQLRYVERIRQRTSSLNAIDNKNELSQQNKTQQSHIPLPKNNIINKQKNSKNKIHSKSIDFNMQSNKNESHSNLYDKGVLFLQQKQLKIEKMKEKKIEEEDEKFPFQPQTHLYRKRNFSYQLENQDQSLKNSFLRPHNQSCFEELYQNHRVSAEKKKKLVQKVNIILNLIQQLNTYSNVKFEYIKQIIKNNLYKKYHEEQFEEYTFQPQINQNSQIIMSSKYQQDKKRSNSFLKEQVSYFEYKQKKQQENQLKISQEFSQQQQINNNSEYTKNQEQFTTRKTSTRKSSLQSINQNSTQTFYQQQLKLQNSRQGSTQNLKKTYNNKLQQQKSKEIHKIKQQQVKKSNDLKNNQNQNQQQNKQQQNLQPYNNFANSSSFSSLRQSQSSLSSYNYNNINKSPQMNKKSEILFQKQKQNSIQDIFNLLDSDNDGILSAENVEISNIYDDVILKLISPILIEMEDLDIQLNFKEFQLAMENLLKDISIQEKNQIIKFNKEFRRQQKLQVQKNNNFKNQRGQFSLKNSKIMSNSFQNSSLQKHHNSVQQQNICQHQISLEQNSFDNYSSEQLQQKLNQNDSNQQPLQQFIEKYYNKN
ncbi:hypothetical protein PPERSA_07984 [Pseudocohnilembus persalinus]|uniref:EF-hand domain-containing protein n=1 Tax=Pseudocohnilembus persalinus TaxID=266149 RepID=A0A0V0QBH2_PSEPJ|nr:hypothetical protein PPERSA_07984 [Pseudocohnilembus persalinus]|eukprot:KRW99499.1 hypothetical protein PPERSA_07984 [Pseudocohnilembus persalinus]